MQKTAPENCKKLRKPPQQNGRTKLKNYTKTAPKNSRKMLQNSENILEEKAELCCRIMSKQSK